MFLGLSTKPLTGWSYWNKLDSLGNETKHKNVNNTNNIIEDPSNDEENEIDSKNKTFNPKTEYQEQDGAHVISEHPGDVPDILLVTLFCDASPNIL